MSDKGEAVVSSRKRKQPPNSSNFSHGPPNAKRARLNRMKDARTILTQASDKALNQNGELDVAAFVKAREFEIKAMEASMGESKNALSSRAFQQVPNDMRRRTASHNVKKVPKRLRSRAAKEMKEDNTPTGKLRRRKPTPQMRLRLETARKLHKLHARQNKRRARAKGKSLDGQNDPEKESVPVPSIRRSKKNTLSKPEQPPAKFRKRQKYKCWLPTHKYHAKRAHMTEPKHPLWRFAIAITPTEKTYRKTHRASSLRGCVAWDISYMSTIQLEGVEASLLGLLRGIGVEEVALSGKRMAKWRRGTRSWQGWVRERDGRQKWIASIVVIWCIQEREGEKDSAATEDPVQTKKPRRRCFLRVHPSAFLQLWTELLKVAKIQRPPVMIEDMRFEIGSIEVTGPGSTEALVAALQPFVNCGGHSIKDKCPEVWSSLGSISNPSCLPANAVLAFDISDPRLRYPPRKIQQATLESENNELLQTLAAWPPDTSEVPPLIFDRTARHATSRSLPSQKAINRRKGDAMPGEFPSLAPTDPRIPILLMASCSATAGAQGSWTLLLPWKCVMPVWYYLMHYPLSTGGNPRFGGLEDLRQIAFEQGAPWFPGDFPGTQAGWEWETAERAKRKADWEKRPKGKRVAWQSLELGTGRKGEVGVGWACDWEYLFNPGTVAETTNTSQATTTDSTTKNDASRPAEAARVTNDASLTLPPPFHHLPLPQSSTILADPALLPQQSQALTTVHITFLSRGNPTTCARIYRLPTHSPQLRAQWLALASSILHPAKKIQRRPNLNPDRKKILASLPRNESHPLRTQQTASSLVQPLSGTVVAAEAGEILQPGQPRYPCVPHQQDLIGYVTTGNFNLGQGKASAIGCVAVAKVVGRDHSPRGPSAGGPPENVSAGDEEMEKSIRKKIEEMERKLGKKLVGRLCIVRDAGQSVGRLARWELV
ncbi:MAG: hypothetical protein LQ345_004272 [Seirophora villosa]|nr:MAG: hypothetical protein LQ345_004272 [Seirophora villosa]